MAPKLAPADAANVIREILNDDNLQAGEGQPIQTLNDRFRRKVGRSDELTQGVEHGVSLGWFIRRENWVGLTEVGCTRPEPSPEQIARTILDTFVNEESLREGEGLPVQALSHRFRQRGGRSEDVAEGVGYAISRRWLTDELKLTEEGYREGSKGQ